jgi:hypothetical protein
VDPIGWATDEISKNWGFVVSAPVPFLATQLLGFTAGWLAIGRFQRERMKHWQELVSEYKDKLNNASPAEVASRISNLENDLAKTKTALAGFGRRVTPKQRSDFAIAAATISRTGFATIITTDEFNPEADAYAKQLADLFRSNGFNCRFGHYQMADELFELPLAVVVLDPENLPPNAEIGVKLFSEIGVEYQIVKEPRTTGNPYPTLFYICVGRNRIES